MLLCYSGLKLPGQHAWPPQTGTAPHLSLTGKRLSYRLLFMQ